jgi:hypothetical protein
VSENNSLVGLRQERPASRAEPLKWIWHGWLESVPQFRFAFSVESPAVVEIDDGESVREFNNYAFAVPAIWEMKIHVLH